MLTEYELQLKTKYFRILKIKRVKLLIMAKVTHNSQVTKLNIKNKSKPFLKE